MSGWTAKRFWTDTHVVADAGGFAIHLDARPVRTPAKTPLIVPTEGMARAIAAEWQAQQGVIKPETMPFTRSANAALDKVATQFDEVVDLLAAYGASDLLCYRAGSPAGLVARQNGGWDPLLAWAAATYHAPLAVTEGIVPVAQPDSSLARLRAPVAAMTPFHLTAFHDLVSITGSLVLALAVTRGRLTAAEAHALSRIDEDWQAEVWGQDDEATESQLRRNGALQHAERFWHLCG